MPQTQTDLVIRAKAEGFQQVQQAAARISQEAAKAVDDQVKGFGRVEKSTQAYQKEVQTLEKNLDNLAKQQMVTLRAMEQVGKGAESYEKLNGVMKDLNDQYRTQERLLQGTNRALKQQAVTSRDLARGGFGQGLMMGAAPGLGMIQRGPGMRQQIAGQMIGRAGRGMMGAPFGGLSGIQQGLAGFGAPGAAVSAQLGTVMQFAQGAMQLQQQQLGMAPFLAGGAGGLQQARMRAEAEEPVPPGLLTQMELKKQVRHARGRAILSGAATGTAEAGAMETAVTNLPISMGGAVSTTAALQARSMVSEKDRKKAATAIGESVREELEKPRRGYEERKGRAGREAVAAETADIFEPIYKAGLELGGISQQQAMQGAMGVLQRGGGGLAGMQQQGMLRTAVAAQTAYGVGGDISGAFLQAGRRGGMVGAGGRGGAAMTEAISDAMRMGLEGSEINEYMAQMAQGIASFQQTGIPINSKSIANMGGMFAGAGLGGVRGRVLGGGMQRAAQGLTQRGIQSSTDLLMAQTMGGFEGGGMAGYEKAMIQLESGKFGEGPEGKARLKEFVGKLMQAGGQEEGGRQVVRNAFKRLGIKMGYRETKAFTTEVMGGVLDPEEAKEAARIREQMREGAGKAPVGLKGLEAQARTAIGDLGKDIQKAARLQNKQNEIGSEFTTTMLLLQESTLRINHSFKTLAAEGVEFLATKIVELTGNIDTFISVLSGGFSSEPPAAPVAKR